MTRMTRVDQARGKAIITGAKRDWAKVEQEERLEAYVTKVVDAAPPLTREQCERIARLLRPRP